MLLAWEIDQAAYEALVSKITEAILSDVDNDTDVNFEGYITESPGIIMSISNVERAEQRMLRRWSAIFYAHGASKVSHVVEETTVTFKVHISANATANKYKSISWGLVAISALYLVLTQWRPQRYNLF